jgi:hypothetical protein
MAFFDRISPDLDCRCKAKGGFFGQFRFKTWGEVVTQLKMVGECAAWAKQNQQTGRIGCTTSSRLPDRKLCLLQKHADHLLF